MIKKLFSHTAIYGLAPQISKVASFFVLPIITKDLTQLDYGISGIILAYTGAISVFSSMGLRLILVNTFFKSPGQYKWAWRQIYGFLSLWAIPYGLALAYLLYLIMPQEARENSASIILLNVLPLVFFGQTSTIATTYYQISQKPLAIGIRTAIFGFLTVFLNLFTISYLKMGYMGWFWSGFIVTMLSNVSYWYPLNFGIGVKPIFNFKVRLIKNSLRVSLPTVPHYYSGYLLNSSDRVVMDWLKVSTGNIGKYNIAYTIGSYVEQLGMAAGFAVGPLMNEKFKQGDDKGARDIVFLLQVVFWLITFLLSIWMREVFFVLISNEVLNKMYPLAIIIVMSYNYRPMYFGSNNKLFFAEKTSLLWRITFVAGLANLLLNIILLPIFGFETAAYTTYLSLMYMGYAGFYFKIFKQINKADYYPSFWFVGTLILTLSAYHLVSLYWVIKIIITILMALTGLSLIYYLNKKKD